MAAAALKQEEGKKQRDEAAEKTRQWVRDRIDSYESGSVWKSALDQVKRPNRLTGADDGPVIAAWAGDTKKPRQSMSAGLVIPEHPDAHTPGALF